MASRRWGVGVAVAVLAVLVLSAAGSFLLRPLGGSRVEHRYPAGGFALSLPSSWQVHPRESGSTPWNWIEAERRTRLGPTDAWLWLNRTQPSGHDPLATARRNALADIRRRWGNVHVVTEHANFAGHMALRLRYSHRLVEHIGFVPGGDVEEVRLITERGGEMYELGVAGWPGLPREAHDLEDLLHLSVPRGVHTIDDKTLGLHIEVPATWNRGQTPRADMPDAVFTATDPSEPASAWTIVWTSDVPVATAVAQSDSKATREGTIIERSHATISGVPATRIDFRREAPTADPTYFSTWIFKGPNGSAWQLLVGSSKEDTAAATRIAASVTLLNS